MLLQGLSITNVILSIIHGKNTQTPCSLYIRTETFIYTIVIPYVINITNEVKTK